MIDFFASAATANQVWIVIALTGVVTYLTRSIGYVVLSRFENLHPRAEAALEAVPGAGLVTLVVPPVLSSGPLEMSAMAVALVASFKLPPIGVLSIGMAIVIAGRMVGW
ncbi:MAG: AzlD domain-containing protein [Pseudomonadota bacterium]